MHGDAFEEAGGVLGEEGQAAGQAGDGGDGRRVRVHDGADVGPRGEDEQITILVFNIVFKCMFKMSLCCFRV